MGCAGAALIAYEELLRLYNDPHVRQMKQTLLDECMEPLYSAAKTVDGRDNGETTELFNDALSGNEEALDTLITTLSNTPDRAMLVYFLYLYAIKGHKYAQYSLSLMYYDKEITGDKAVKDTLFWMSKAAEDGDPRYTGALGYVYIYGSGTKADIKKGLGLTKKAAQQNDPDALETLGACHYNGIGTAVNHKLAKKYWRDSAQAGNETAVDNLKKHFNITVNKPSIS